MFSTWLGCPLSRICDHLLCCLCLSGLLLTHSEASNCAFFLAFVCFYVVFLQSFSVIFSFIYLDFALFGVGRILKHDIHYILGLCLQCPCSNVLATYSWLPLRMHPLVLFALKMRTTFNLKWFCTSVMNCLKYHLSFRVTVSNETLILH